MLLHKNTAVFFIINLWTKNWESQILIVSVGKIGAVLKINQLILEFIEFLVNKNIKATTQPLW